MIGERSTGVMKTFFKKLLNDFLNQYVHMYHRKHDNHLNKDMLANLQLGNI